MQSPQCLVHTKLRKRLYVRKTPSTNMRHTSHVRSKLHQTFVDNDMSPPPPKTKPQKIVLIHPVFVVVAIRIAWLAFVHATSIPRGAAEWPARVESIVRWSQESFWQTDPQEGRFVSRFAKRVFFGKFGVFSLAKKKHDKEKHPKFTNHPFSRIGAFLWIGSPERCSWWRLAIGN